MAVAATYMMSGCVASQRQGAASYEGVRTILLDGDLVNFQVRMSKEARQSDVLAYAECAAAQYTLVRGYGFTRLVRVNLERNGDFVEADAVYTISEALPRGSRKIDAEVTVAECGRAGIPTV